jgi:hypothetical protein
VADFVPEMHDLGKLCDKTGLQAILTTKGDVDPHTHTGPSFSNIRGLDDIVTLLERVFILMRNCGIV